MVIWFFCNIVLGVTLAVRLPSLGKRADGSPCNCATCTSFEWTRFRVVVIGEFVAVGFVLVNLALLFRIAGGG